jgi:hypothetical protein
MELRLSFLRIIVARAMDLMADRRYAALLGDPREKASQHKAPYAALRETVPRLIVLSIPKSSPAFTSCGRVLLSVDAKPRSQKLVFVGDTAMRSSTIIAGYFMFTKTGLACSTAN